jgi:hypothetical protein
MNLESRFFFRLVNVLYFTFLPLFLLVVIYSGYKSIPKKYIDNEKSFLVCANGFHTFKSLALYLGSTDTKLNSINNEIALITCRNDDSRVGELPQYRRTELLAELKRRATMSKELRAAENLARLKMRAMNLQLNHPPYELSLGYSETGSWKDVFLWWFLGGSIIYITLNIMRGALLYLVFGRRFAWNWLLILPKTFQARFSTILIKSNSFHDSGNNS